MLSSSGLDEVELLMTPDRPTPPSRPGRNEPWRIERMVQRVPSHLGEAPHEPVSPWIVIAGVILLFLVSCGVLFVLLDVPTRLASLGVSAATTPTRTPRVVTPAVTGLTATLPPPPPSPAPTSVAIKYKVKAGDTLIAIAAKYRVSVQAIMAANGLKDETIRAGDELLIPLPTPTPAPGAAIPPSQPVLAAVLSTPTSLAATPAPASSIPAATPGVVQYTVKSGDTLSSIAGIYSSTIEAIRVANRLTDDMLSVGQVLLIPTGAWTPTSAPVAVIMPTATPTSQYAYAAPSLISPPDGQGLHGSKDLPTLQWVSPAILKPDELYVVHIDYMTSAGAKKSIVKEVKQGTSLPLAATDYPGASANGTAFSWYVLIVSQSKAKVAAADAQATASSPPSEIRTFTWY